MRPELITLIPEYSDYNLQNYAKLKNVLVTDPEPEEINDPTTEWRAFWIVQTYISCLFNDIRVGEKTPTTVTELIRQFQTLDETNPHDENTLALKDLIMSALMNWFQVLDKTNPDIALLYDGRYLENTLVIDGLMKAAQDLAATLKNVQIRLFFSEKTYVSLLPSYKNSFKFIVTKT